MWGQILGAVAGPLLNGMMGGGGGGSQQPQQQQSLTSSREPWAAAVPWLTENLRTGQNLQAGYAANPFSALQKQTYNNQLGNSDYFRSMVDSVLGQQNQQKPFDRSNPSARPQTYQMPSRTQPAMPTSATPYSMGQDPFGAQQSFAQAVAPQGGAAAAAPSGMNDFDYLMWKHKREQGPNHAKGSATNSYHSYQNYHDPSSVIGQMTAPREGF